MRPVTVFIHADNHTASYFRSCFLFNPVCFFFQAEDGIRDADVTGVQTCVFFFSSRRRHTRWGRDWSSDVCSSDLHEVAKLSEFTDDPAAIGKSFATLEKFAETRPNETADMLGEKGPRVLRSVINVLGSTLPKERPTKGVLNDAIYQAATALQSEPTERRKIVLVISDGQVAGPNAHTFDSTTELLLNDRIQFYGVSTKFATFGSYGTLTAYARAAGGDGYPGTSTKSIESAFSNITEQARYEYVLGYVSNNETQLAVFRNIKVRTRSANQTVLHRKGYVQYPQP